MSSSSPQDPESILDAYLAGNAEPNIGALCRQHPEHAEDLRRLWFDEERIRALIGEVLDQDGGSVFARRGRDRTVSAPQVAARVGDTIGEFELVEVLGHGGMGQVWLAEQTSLGRRVALKLVRPECVNERTMALFAREARAGGRLSHPGIVSVYGYGESDGVAWIAMELVKGAWTLRDAIDELDAEEELPKDYYEHVARFVAALADALQAAHEAGVIHRDLKPQNILVTQDDQPKLTDFGLARIADEAAISVTGDFAGTYFYMSPEQVAARRMGIDHRTDVFSLGVVLYEMLTLQRPFQGDTTHQVAEQILIKEPQSPRAIRSKVPANLAVICGKCLEKDRDRRFVNMREVATDLRRHLADEPILAKPPTAVQRGVKWVKRHPTTGVAAALVTVGVAVISVLLAQNVRTNSDLEQKTKEALELAGSNEALAAQRAEQARIAEAQTQIAKSQAWLAERRAEDVLRLAAQQDVEDLVEEQATLWPPHPANVGAYRAWLARAKALVAALPEHRSSLERFGAVHDEPSLEALEEWMGSEAQLASGVSQEALREVEDRIFDTGSNDKPSERILAAKGLGTARAKWWKNRLDSLIGSLEALQDQLIAEDVVTAEYGWSVAKRLRFAERLEAGFSEGGEFDLIWQDALPTIAEAYPDLDLEPQMGLVPIGPDPVSGLWEFAHLATGEPAVRGEDGVLVLTEDTGVVLVLIPAGSFWMGAQGDDPEGRNYDAKAQRDEGPVHEVSLSAHFLSKFEMTQGQWQRFCGENPSTYGPHRWGMDWSRGEDASLLLHPVELVSWLDCDGALSLMGLSLPTEAQWEHGCRAGTSSVYWSGDEIEGLDSVANVADQYALNHGGSSWREHEPTDDGNLVHGAVGSYRANAYGLHETHGNVWEWCLDGYDSSFYSTSGAADPFSDPSDAASCVNRGGGYGHSASSARAAYRSDYDPSAADDGLGVRPARAITE